MLEIGSWRAGVFPSPFVLKIEGLTLYKKNGILKVERYLTSLLCARLVSLFGHSMQQAAGVFSFCLNQKEDCMSTGTDEFVSAVREEAHLHHEQYQVFARRAEEKGYSQVAKFFRAIVAAEKARVGLYLKCLADLGNQSDTYDYYICINCGLALTLSAPEECPLCHTPGAQFERIS
jgi:rubrerythrin